MHQEAAVIVPAAELELRRRRSETLILINIINAEGRLIVRTVWATTRMFAAARGGPASKAI